MRFLGDAIDRFCYKHPRFGIPNLMTIIIALQAAVYILNMVSSYTFSTILYFSRAAILHGQIWRLITFAIVPSSSSVITFAISLYFYWFIGSNLEREWGCGKFTIYYLCGIILTAIVGMFTGYATTTYLNYSLFLAFASLYPNLQFLLFFIIPIKAKWLAWIDAALIGVSFVAAIIQLDFATVVLILASLLMYLIFFWNDLMYLIGREKRHTKSKITNLHRAAAQREEQTGYMHKCAVCGRTDVDSPDLEFRYCSKCVGYYCYCMDHINSHIHITE